jgi:hypothetical protein
MGHEIVGTVAACGRRRGAQARGCTGGGLPWIGCGACRHCLNGVELDCETPCSLGTRRAGGYSSHVLVPHPRYVLPHDGIDALVAASASCSGLTAYAALKKLPIHAPDETIVIVGAGGLGPGRAGPGAPAARRRPHRGGRRQPRQAGRRTRLGRRCDRHPRRRTAGPRCGPSPRAARHGVVDFVGLPQTFEWSLAALRKGGTLIEVGLFGGGVAAVDPAAADAQPERSAARTSATCRTSSDLLALLKRPGVTAVPIQHHAHRPDQRHLRATSARRPRARPCDGLLPRTHDPKGDLPDDRPRARQRDCQQQELWQPGRPACPVPPAARRRPAALDRARRFSPVLDGQPARRRDGGRAPERPFPGRSALQAVQHRVRADHQAADAGQAAPRARACRRWTATSTTSFAS